MNIWKPKQSWLSARNLPLYERQASLNARLVVRLAWSYINFACNIQRMNELRPYAFCNSIKSFLIIFEMLIWSDCNYFSEELLIFLNSNLILWTFLFTPLLEFIITNGKNPILGLLGDGILWSEYWKYCYRLASIWKLHEICKINIVTCRFMLSSSRLSFNVCKA